MDQLSAHLDRGWDLASKGEYHAAWLSAQKILQLDEHSPEAHNLLGYIHAAQGEAEEALDHYQQAMELDDNFVEAKLNAAEVLIHPLAHYDDALELVEEALEVAQEQDEVADALLLKIEALLQKGNQDRARVVSKQLPSGPFDNPRLGFLVGKARFDVGDLEGAETLLKDALQQDPDNPDVHYYYGLWLQAHGMTKEALAAFLTAREIDHQAPPYPGMALSADQLEKRVRAAIEQLSQDHRAMLEGVMVVVSDLPGPEVVADGIDPRVPLLLDGFADEETGPRVRRLFVYQRNVERRSRGAIEMQSELAESLGRELSALGPTTIASRRRPI